MNKPSIRRTLLLRCSSGTAILLCILSLGVYELVRQSLYRELDESISQTAALLANQVEYEDYSVTFEWKEGAGTNLTLEEHGLFQFWEENTSITTRSAALHSSDLTKFSGIGGQPLYRSILLPDGRRARAIGLRIYPFVLIEEIESMKAKGEVVDPKTMPFTLVVARDSEPVSHTLARLRWILAFGALLTLGLGFIIIQRIVNISLQPIDELTTQMEKRAAHQLDSALVVPGELPVELGGLARSFDSLLSRVADTRQRERDFIRHAAHELRTPIAGLRAITELALSQPRDAAAYAAHLTTCRKTAIELSELVKRLSALARIGQSTSPHSLQSIDLRNTLQACLESFRPRFEAAGLVVSMNFPAEPLIANCDLTLLRMIFNNLLDNAASYAAPPEGISIVGRRQGNRLELSFSNRAEDLPENPERLFEPLFRKEASRSDAGTHLGIGLTLSLEAASAMGAALHAKREKKGWITFILVVPV